MRNPRDVNRPRTAVTLSSRLESNLLSYVTAASAAGITLTALTPLAEASIVYKSVNITVTNGTKIDINGDGIPDFSFGYDDASHSVAFVVNPLNAVGAVICNNDGAVAGVYGNPVGKSQKFCANTASHYFNGKGVVMAVGAYYGGKTYFFGPWAGAKNRYLGVRFTVGLNTHFGWIRMSVPNFEQLGTKITITGYAFETTAKTEILEGHTKGALSAAQFDLPAHSSMPATLGLLALGQQGLAIWRREDEY